MPVENATHIAGLVEANPAGSETISEGDDHIRLTKFCVRNTLPNFNTTVSLTSDELNALPTDIAAVDAKADQNAADIAANYTDLQGQISTGDSNTGIAANAYADAADLVTLANANAYTDTREIAINAKIVADVGALETSKVDPNAVNITTNTNGIANHETRIVALEDVVASLEPGGTEYDAAVAEANRLDGVQNTDLINPLQTDVAINTTNIASNAAAIAALQGSSGGLTAAEVNDLINTAITNMLNSVFPVNTAYVGNAAMRNNGSPPVNYLPGNWVEILGDFTFGTTNDGDTIIGAPFYGNFDNNAGFVEVNDNATGTKLATRQRYRMWVRTS